MSVVFIPMLGANDGTNTDGIRSEHHTSAFRIEHDTDPFHGQSDVEGLTPDIGSSRGDLMSDDSLEFVPIDPTLVQETEGLTPTIGSTRGDVIAENGFESLELADTVYEAQDVAVVSSLLDSMGEGETCGV